MPDFSHLRPDDLVYRQMGANGPKMLMRVREISDTIITCDTAEGFRGGWTFDRKTGVEEDEDLGWGVKHGVTGTFLTHDPVVS